MRLIEASSLTLIGPSEPVTVGASGVLATATVIAWGVALPTVSVAVTVSVAFPAPKGGSSRRNVEPLTSASTTCGLLEMTANVIGSFSGSSYQVVRLNSKTCGSALLSVKSSRVSFGLPLIPMKFGALLTSLTEIVTVPTARSPRLSSIV